MATLKRHASWVHTGSSLEGWGHAAMAFQWIASPESLKKIKDRWRAKMQSLFFPECLFPVSSLLLTRIPVKGFRTLPNPVWLHLTQQIRSAKIPCPNKVTFWGSRGTLYFRGTLLSHYKHHNSYPLFSTDKKRRGLDLNFVSETQYECMSHLLIWECNMEHVVVSFELSVVHEIKNRK